MNVKKQAACLALVALGSFSLAACSKGADPAGVPAEAPADGATAAADAGNGADATPVASTQDPSTPGAATPAAKQELSLLEKGRRRTVSLKEAVDGLGAPLYEPKRLPKDAVRSVVHLIELIDGIENPALPAVRQIWDLAAGGSFILVQSKARGDLGGEPNLKVGEADAYLGGGKDQRVLTFERDGAQFELRSAALTAQQLQEMAASLEPVDSNQPEAPVAGREDLGAILSGAEGTAAVAATTVAGTVAPPAATAKP